MLLFPFTRQRFLRRITAFLLVLGACLLPATSFAQPSTTATLVWGQSGSFTTNGFGTTATAFVGPYGVVLDGSGNLYVADGQNNRVLYFPAGSTTATAVYGQSNFTTGSVAASTSSTSLSDPQGVALDSGGNLYVGDTYNNRVLYFPAGSTTPTKVYGQSNFTNSGGGTSATALGAPQGVAVDSSGNLYVADTFNNRVLYFPAGSTTATTVYGQGGSFTTHASGAAATALNGPQGVALDSSGNLYVADSANNRVLYFPSGSTTATRVYGQGGSFTTSTSGTSATALNNPQGVALDGSGNLYVADSGNNRVLYFPSGSTTATGVYGQSNFTTGTAPVFTSSTNLRYPRSVALDSGGNLYVADSYQNRVVEFAVPATTYTLSGPSGGALSMASTNFTVVPNGNYTGTVTITPSGGGLSTTIVLTFNSPAAQTFTITPTAVGPVTLTPSNTGSLANATALTYSTPPAAPTITSVTPGSSQITVAFAANGTGGSAITGYAATCGASTISGATSPIVVTGLTNGTAYTCTVTATNTYGAGAASTASSSVTPIGPATGYAFNGPSGGFVNAASGSFAVTPNGLYTGTVTITPSGGGLSTPIVLTFSNSFTAQTFTITPTAAGTVTLTPTNNGSLTNASALTLTARGLQSATASMVWGQGGSFTTRTIGTSATTLQSAWSVALDSSGNLYVSDSSNNRVLYYPAGSTTATSVYGQGGSFTTTSAGTSATALNDTRSIVLDSGGNLYVVDAHNNRVLYYPAGSTTATRVYGQGGSFTTNTSGASATALNTPTGVAVDSGGNVYIADDYNNRVLYYPAGSTTATRVYGQGGSFTTTAAGISATALNGPGDVAVDSAGNLYVADSGNNRVLYYPAGSTTATAVYGQGGSFTTGTSGTSATALNNPTGVALDSSGNLYVADFSNNRVLCYPAGSTTAAGVYGQGGSFTTSTSGTSATGLYYPSNIALDNSGNLYVADYLNNRVLEFAVPATGYTLSGPSGGAVSAASTNFTVTPNGNYTGTVTVTPSGGGLSTPIVLTFNSPASQTFTITPTAAGPVTLTPSNNGSLTDATALSYLTSPAAPSITSVTPGHSQITVAFTANATGGSAITGYAATCGPSTISGPSSPIVVTGLTDGTVYTCTVTATNTYGTSAASTASGPVTEPLPPATGFAFTGPSGGFVNTASGSFTVSPNGTYTGTVTITPSGGGLSTPIVLTFSSSSTAQTFTITPAAAGTVTLTPTNNGSFTNPPAVSLTARVLPSAIESVVWGQGGSFTTSAAGISATGLNAPFGVAVDSSGNLYVADAGNNRVLYYPAGSTTPNRVYGQSSFTTRTSGTSATALHSPEGIALDSSGNLYVADEGNNRVLYYPAGSTTATKVYGQSSFTTNSRGTSASSLTSPSAVAVDSSGNLYITDAGNNRVLYYPAGSTTATAVYGQSSFTTFNPGTSLTGLSAPFGVAVDSNGNLYVADNSNQRVVFYPAGSTTATAVYGSLSPIGVAVDSSGNLFVADAYNNRVLAYPAGSTTAAGVYGQSNFTATTSGTSATALHYPWAVALDSSGNLYVADRLNNRVVEFAVPATAYTLTGPSGGALSTASTNFTVTPNGTYTGTITITPSGGGLSTPIVLTFNSSAAQTFTITPTAAGPVTLTPSNNGSLTDAAALSYSTAPAAPGITSVLPGYGQLTVAFAANGTGGSAITGYAATCGSSTIPGSGSPIVVTGLTNGTAYTCTVTATNTYGTSAASTASNPVGPIASATTFTFTGPSVGFVNNASGSFTVTPNSSYTGTITITPSGGGLSTPIVLTFSNSSTAQTFTITPTAAGTVTLTPTNNGSLTNAASLTARVLPIAIESAVWGQGGSFTTSAAGTSATALNGPGSVALDSNGNLFVADAGNDRVLYYPAGSTTATRVYGQSSFTTSTFGGTSATALNYPGGIAVDGGGNLYVTDSNNNRVLYYPAGSTTATRVYGQSSFTTRTSGTSATALYGPSGLAVDSSGNLYVADQFNNRVLYYPAGSTTATRVYGQSGFTTSAAGTSATALNYPGGIAVDGSGNLYVADLYNNRVLYYPAGSTTATLVYGQSSFTTGTSGTSATALNYPTGVALDNTGNLYVADSSNNRVLSYPAGSTTAGGIYGQSSFTTSAAGTSATALNYPGGIAVDGSGNLYVADEYNNRVVEFAAPATTYTLSGPAGGALSTASTNFTVTPNGTYTGTITITPSGGGLSTPIVLTFSSPASQTFTITPTSVGPVTLTPTNNGGLTDAAALSYSTPPAAPSITSVTPGNGQIAVAFTANATGGSAITGYAATCGSRTISGTYSPISVTGLTNGTAYTCTVAATNANGTSGASTASNSVTPVSGVSSYTLTGPAGGLVGAASANFTVTPNGPYTGTITITESGGGLSTATVLTFSNSSAAQTFTITPTAVGPVTLTPTNNGSLANPRALAYNTPPAAPTVTSATAGNAQITVGFTANGTGGSAITGYAATCGTSTIMGVYSPIVVTGLTNGTAYTCTVTATNAIGTSSASATSNAVTPYVPGYTFSGPVSGTTGAASKVFTVTPSGALTGTVTITPSGGGLTAPITLTFNQSYVPQTFTITPVSTGPVVLTPANSAGLVNPPVLTYTTSTSSITITSATPANGSIEVYFTTAGGSPQLRRHVGPAADSVSQGGGAQADYYQAACVTNPATTTYYGQGTGSPILVTGLANGTPYVCTVTAIYLGGNAGTSNPYPAVTPSAPSGAATGYTLSGPLGGAVGTASTNFTVTPNGTYTGAIAVGLSGGGLSGSTVLTFNGSYAPQTFTITPSAIGPVTLTPSSNGSLTDAAALSYATGPGVLAAPVATPGNGLIFVAFAAGTATGGAQADYYTASCTAGNTVYFGQNTATPVVVTGLTNGTTYTCSVTATNFVGTSAASAASNAATPMAPASLPSAPTIVSVTAGPGSATVAFTAPTNTGGLPITGYAATCGSVTVQGTSSPITVAWLFGGGSFNCSVAAMNAMGTGPSSASIAVTPLSTFPPATGYVFAGPLGGPVGRSSSNFTLTPNNSFYGNITVTPSGGGLSTPITLNWAGSGVAQPFTITPLTVGPVVLTPNSNGGLPDAAPLIYSTPPAAPAMGGATWSNGTVSVAFTPGANGGSPITAYTAVCSASNAPLLTATGAASPIVLAGLNGTAYTCAVTATNAFGTSLASAASNYVTPGVPGSPLSVSAAAGNGQATVTFAAPAAIGVPPVTGYTVVSSPGGVAVHAAASPVTVTGLTNGTAYTFTVTAANGYGSGPGAVSNSVTPSAGSQTLSMLQPLFPVGVQGAEYPVQILSASGGTLPYTYSVDTGALPSGLALAGSAFGGTPASAGETAFTIRVTDAAGNSVSSAASISIEPVGPDLILSDALVSSIPASVAVRSSDVTQMLGYTVAAADPWLVVSGGGMAPGSISVEAAPGLAAGTYRSEITVSCAAASACAGSTKTVAVVLNVAAAGPVTQVDQRAVATPDGAQFRAPAGNPLGNPVGSFTAAGTWLASVLPGANWLSLTSQAGAVNFTVDPLQSAGVYSGTIRVTSADGSQIDHAVVLDVLAAGTPVKPELSAAGLTFAQGAAAAQQVSIYAGSSVPLAYQAAASAAWLSVSPVTGTAMAGAPGSSVISVNPAGLAPGVYRGGVSYAFASDAVRTVNVTMVVPSSACDPAQLVATHNGLPQNFQTAVGLPVELTMNVVNGCGAPVSSAQVTVAFSNGDAPVMLRAVDGAPGMYTGGWMPQAAGSQVAVTATAVGQTGTALAVITGKVTPY